MGTNPNSIRDKRLDINKIFDLQQEDTTNNKTLNNIFEYYKEKLDINTFRDKFNDFLIENSDLILDKDYNTNNNNKDWTFRLLIVYGRYETSGNTILANDYYNTDNTYINSLSKFLKSSITNSNDNSGFISYIKGIEDYYPDPDSVGSGDPVIGSGDDEQHKIRNIKNTVFLVKNLIVVNILKYYFLSELLMKSLLDTQLENSGSNTLGSDVGSSFGSNDNDLISQTFENDISSTFDTERDIGFNKSHESYYRDRGCIKNKQYHNDISNTIASIIWDDGVDVDGVDVDADGNVEQFLYSINKIIYDMYVLSSMLKENAKLFRLEHTKNLHFGSGDLRSQIRNFDLKTTIDNINNKIVNFNQKNTDIQKNYEKNRNLFYIIVGSVILYIIFNMYIISVNNIDSLLIINLVIIIVIFIIKFLAIARKLYKSLVKDMNN